MSLKYQNITDVIIAAYFFVYNNLGYGFLEKVYENAFAYELRKRGLKVEQQVRIKVYYDGTIVGEYIADLVVQGVVLCELKANESTTNIDLAQLINYLRATEIEVGLLFNFGPKPKFERRFLSNENKKHLIARSQELEK